jgi:UDP-N-acetylmuramyl pentapeptide phosphotransferase/UDP-N-acetylglucosamine-1-phosphate transferase
MLVAAAIGLAVTGGIDDLRPLPALLRVGIQTVAIGAVLLSLPDHARVFPSWPFWLERAALLVAAIWFVNLMNFMDGLDWITVAEVVPIAATLMVFGLIGMLPMEATAMAAALTGAMLGFAPFNRPVAKLFLGDVGSIAIGLIVAWLLFVTAATGHLAAAILLPLYYLCDATITLLRRLFRGEKVWQAHRSHFYQRATDNGFSVMRIVGTIFVLNLGLAVLAGMAVFIPTLPANTACLIAGLILVAVTLLHFTRKTSRSRLAGPDDDG